ncbi:hypothetical protein BDW59DRAFT_179378 [Aspergillus cavernicola]|uniref:Nephrocystin 3-like N-terminal domain-containing protein n=1 Tax=Aspergillus cavernicola TaxID=176166 RepID=A0ABR4IIL3_9EURO
MAPSILSPGYPLSDGIFRSKRMSSSRRVSGIHDGESVTSGVARSVQSRRVTSRKFNSMGMTDISGVVSSLQCRSGDEIGNNASSGLLTATHATILDWIRSERMSLLPPEGSDYDKVLAWTLLFVDRLDSFDLEIEKFAGDSYLAAQLSYGYCALLLELGRENSDALMASFGFFYSISMSLANLLERTELFNVTQEIQEQLLFALSDLVSLVARVSTYFHKARCERIAESMWRHQLLRENLDGARVSEVKAIRSWLAPEDPAISSITENSSHLAHDREELTCLWMGPYLTRFLKTQQKHLSITGPPGSGKTVLASVIVDHLQHPHSGGSYQTLLVPINSRIAAQTSSYAIAKAIICQLLEKRIGNVQLFRILSDALHRSRVAVDYETYDSILWDAMDQALAASLHGANQLVLMVDGVDEASCGEDKMLQRLTRSSTRASNPKLITLGSRTPLEIAGQTRIRISDELIFDEHFCEGDSCWAYCASVPELVSSGQAHCQTDPSREKPREFSQASIQTDKQTISETCVETPQALKPLNSLVFRQYDHFFLRHGLIRTAIVDLFSPGKVIPSLKDRHADLATRLLVYITGNVTEQQEPSSLPPLDYHDANSHLEKSPLLEFALRYWVPLFRQTAVFTKDGDITAFKDIAKVLPSSTTAVRLLRSVWGNVSTPELVTYQTTLTNIYRKVLTAENVTTLQAIITLANLYRQVKHPEPFTLFYEAAILSQKLLTTRHIVTMQMVTVFLEMTFERVIDSKTDIMVQREQILLVLVECYKVHYTNTSEKVVSVLQQLAEHYWKVKDTQKAQSIMVKIQSITSTDYGSSSNGASGSLDVQLVGPRRRWSRSDSGYLLNLDFEEEDEAIETAESYGVEDLINFAEKHLQSGKVDFVERIYVEFWQRATRESRVHSSAVWEEKKIQAQKREHESSSVLTSFWQDYQHTSVSISESSVVHLQEIAKVMKSVGLSTTALSLLQTTSQEVMQSATSSTSIVSESTLEEMILETSISTSSIDQSFYSSTETLVGLYISQRRWQHATRTIKTILHNTWSAFFATTFQDVTLPHKHVDSSLSLAERLAQCYHARHRLVKEQDTRLRIYYAVRSGLNVEDKLRQHHVAELLRLLERTSQTEVIISVYQELLNDYTKHYGSDHTTVIQTLRTLAELTRPRPIFLAYYQQIIQALNKDGKQCHPDALEPLNIVATELWNQGRHSDALHYCAILFTAFLNQPKLSPKLQGQHFCLRAARTEFSTLHKVTLDYQAKCKAATLTLAQLSIRLYEELVKIKSEHINQSAILSNSELSESASSTQVEQAVRDYGWAHEESLIKMKEIIGFHFRQKKTELVVQELQEATVQILSSETSTMRLSQAASTIKAIELSEEVYRQSSNFDLTSKGRQRLIFLAQLEHHLHRQSSTITEILASLTTEMVYFEEFQQQTQSKSSFLTTSASAARLYHFLITNNRQSIATHVGNEFVNYFLANEGKRIGFNASSEVKVTHQSQDILVKSQKYDEACDLALAYRTPAIARFVLALSMNVSGRGIPVNEAARKKMLHVSGTIIQDMLKVLRELKINIAQVGEQRDYPTLAMRDWDPYVTLSLGRLYIMVRYLVGDTLAAVRLAEDIVYNCRRVHGARHASTLQIMGQSYQSHKDGQDLTNRYYKRSAALHENVLRALSVPAFADLDGSLDGGMSADGSTFDGDFGNGSLSDSGDHIRQHFKLFKLAIQRLGGWPKDYSEYERLNAELFREYPSALEGVQGIERWDFKGFGVGKAESNEDLVDADFKDWQLFSSQRLVDGIEEEL